MIKKRQRIAGEYQFDWHGGRGYPEFLSDRGLKVFLFSVNRQKIYPLVSGWSDRALWCDIDSGPSFGNEGLFVEGDYKNRKSSACMNDSWCSAFYAEGNEEGELFGTKHFTPYEVCVITAID